LDLSSTLESWADDVVTVMEAVGSPAAAVMGSHDGGMAAMMFAATHPQRTSSLILVNTSAKVVRDEAAPWAIPREVHERLVGDPARWYGSDGPGMAAATGVFAGEGSQFQRWWTRSRRHQASPDAFSRLIELQWNLDLRSILGSIQAPTLVIHGRDNDFFRFDHARYLADNIPDASLVAIPGLPHEWHAGHSDAVIDEIQTFLTGAAPAPDPERVLATVVFTDIVESTRRAAAVGDRSWKELLGRFRTATTRQVEAHRGREVNRRGDDVLVTFDGPARAVRYAIAVREAAGDLGIEVRSGLHTGEVELMGDDVAGIAVHIGARVAERAGPGEVLVSRTVVDLVAGSGLEFRDYGEHELMGVPGAWRIFSVVP
jgi:class 3 adenylate cyclase